MAGNPWRIEERFLDLFKEPAYKDWVFWAFGVWEFLVVVSGLRFLGSFKGGALIGLLSFTFGLGFSTTIGLIPVRARYKKYLFDSELEDRTHSDETHEEGR